MLHLEFPNVFNQVADELAQKEGVTVYLQSPQHPLYFRYETMEQAKS